MSLYDGARARALRLEAGIAVEDLAVAAGVSPNTVRSVESGKHQPRPRVAHGIARALGVSVEELTLPGSVQTLRDIRLRLGRTQSEMAAHLGVVRQMVSQVERGVNGVRSPSLWAAAYGLTLAQWTDAQRASRDLVWQKVAAQTHRR
ncbi:helix-turn-helix transcriptional regulator [Streptomyces sp. NPDC056112]|uniref:helix-turn-helix transcriptional regulator n=1 Tax=Streptomyces sp. NPDC056112 TaxID=3345715 RepID=UPI0035E0E4FF